MPRHDFAPGKAENRTIDAILNLDKAYDDVGLVRVGGGCPDRRNKQWHVLSAAGGAGPCRWRYCRLAGGRLRMATGRLRGLGAARTAGDAPIRRLSTARNQCREQH